MGEQRQTMQNRRTVPRWTFWEMLGLLLSALMVAVPLLSLAYTFVFPPPAPAAPMAPTPTSNVTPGEDTPTPVDTPTTTPTPSDTPTPTPSHTGGTPTPTPTNPPSFSVGKAASTDRALLGEQVIFSIGLSNGGSDPVTVRVIDTLPGRLSQVGEVIYTCGGSYPNSLIVLGNSSCQVYLSTVVNEVCDCYVVNHVDVESAGGDPLGSADSQPVFLSSDPTPTPTAGPTLEPPLTQPPTDTPATPVTTAPTTPPSTAPTTSPTTPPTTAPTTPPTTPPT
ncbi:MAG: hypothetical protein JXA37_04475, partial [Chloroflexia bacterium]|nr:hypothetical protein [Chloroflexia bacterium]